MKVSDVMTQKPVSVRRNSKLKHVIRTMVAHNISGCPVTDSKNNVVGLVTRTDIINILDVHRKVHKTRDMLGFVLSALRSQEFEKLKVPLRNMLEKEVHRFMTSDPITINAGDDLYEAAKSMSRHKIDKLVVVRNKKLVGIITKGDLIKSLDKLEA